MSKKVFLVIPIIIFVITTLVLNSCVENEDTKQKNPKVIEAENYIIYTLDECEYVRFGFGQASWGGHKGDCSNPIHKGQHPSVYELESSEDLYDEEKHFDCSVETIEEDGKGGYFVETECGIFFESKKKYERGEILHNFVSPKHK